MDRSQIRVLGRVGGATKKGLQVMDTTMIREKRGISWDRSQIRVSKRPLYSFFTPVELYFGLNNIAVTKCQKF
jgi:hypothetical protein